MSIESTVQAQDHIFMARAIQLAKKGQYTTHPNPRVGCVIVKNNKIIAEGFHEFAGQAHAEINAVNAAQESLEGTTVYVTLEPCSHTGKTPPCANALIEAKVGRVVIAMQDPNPEVSGKGIQILKAANIDVDVGVLEAQARILNPGFIKRMEHGLPWVRIKLAMSLDGKTAMASGESQWITGKEARKDVQYLRAKASAILTGSGTVIDDDPSLNVRLSSEDLGIQGHVQQPLRVVLDSHLRISREAKMLEVEGNTQIYTKTQDVKKIKGIKAHGTDITLVKKTEYGLDLHHVLTDLAIKQINEVHVEAGAMLSGALLQQNLVDEIIIYMAPCIMGDSARGLLKLPGLDKMKDKINLKIIDIRSVGDDWRFDIKPVKTKKKNDS